ncbi:integrin [Thalassolituus hydrocarboniclasticus]|uniref:Integrin n=2 Tax=Thalassolituus hydrocarboniclasticus TaxID=2742796 RepID=A0ABY6AFR9_9GAMM|nr:integrin [Thalassolituus hydrocarboniclasticus]
MAESGYRIDDVSGCDGTLQGSTYTTGAITADCTVEASFMRTHRVAVNAGAGGSISPDTAQVVDTETTTSFEITADNGYRIDGVSGCDGALQGSTYTTGAITADCTIEASFIPADPVLSLSLAATKTFSFSWQDVAEETEYRLLESLDGQQDFTQIQTLPADTTSYQYSVFLPQRVNARYRLQACNLSDGYEDCRTSAEVTAQGSLTDAVGYVKAARIDWGLNDPAYRSAEGQFGLAVALSADGSTLAVGMPEETNLNSGIDAEQSDIRGNSVGAVYVFRLIHGQWLQQAYIKASNADELDSFGSSLALSGDGSTLAVGAFNEGSSATGVNGVQADNSTPYAGAVYVFQYSGAGWAQQAYIKASNTGAGDRFGRSLALSADGSTLAVGAFFESSSATGVDGDQADNSAYLAGAIYMFQRAGLSWTQQAYIKASNTGVKDQFGISLALSADGSTLAVSALAEASSATGVGGDETDDSLTYAGAVYVFLRADQAWAQQAYIKASNTGANDYFGSSVALSADGSTLAVGAQNEGSSAAGVGAGQEDNSASKAGAVYVFQRTGLHWAQQAYLKASNTGTRDNFGYAVALSADGDSLAVSAPGERSSAAGINGEQMDDAAYESGAVYLFQRTEAGWAQPAYIKASNTGYGDTFGRSVALSADGQTLAVGAPLEASSATGVNGDQTNNNAVGSGAVYLY